MVNEKIVIRRRCVCSLLFALITRSCLYTTTAECPGNLRNKIVIPVAEIRELNDEIANVTLIKRGPLEEMSKLTQCRLLEKMSKILDGDHDGSFLITGDGLLLVNTTLNSTKRSLYTLNLSLLEKWKVGEDGTFLTINQLACVEICVCPGASDDCVPESTLTPTPVVQRSSPDVLISRTTVTSSTLSPTSHITHTTISSSEASTTQQYLTSKSAGFTVRVISKRYDTTMTLPTKKVGSVPSAGINVEEQLRLVIILGSMVLAVAVLIILLLGLQLYKKSSKHWCMTVHSAPVSPHDIEMSTNRDLSEPLPDSELFYYYYTEMDSQVEAPGFVSSNRRDMYHVNIKPITRNECNHHGYDDHNQQGFLRFVSQHDLSDKTAKWVDEQRRITERRTSMPTALDDVSVDSRNDEGGDSLPEFSFRSLPSHLPVNIVADNNIILTNPLAKVGTPQVCASSQLRESSISSLASGAVRHGSDCGSLEYRLPPVEHPS